MLGVEEGRREHELVGNGERENVAIFGDFA
jgi:hypothetical protein